MAITHKARNAAAQTMAKVLNETVCDLRNGIECRTQLGFSGFTDQQIGQHLADAQHVARNMRAAEIERRARNQWDVLDENERPAVLSPRRPRPRPADQLDALSPPPTGDDAVPLKSQGAGGPKTD